MYLWITNYFKYAESVTSIPWIKINDAPRMKTVAPADLVIGMTFACQKVIVGTKLLLTKSVIQIAQVEMNPQVE